jgi:hypothetical protein
MEGASTRIRLKILRKGGAAKESAVKNHGLFESKCSNREVCNATILNDFATVL